MPADLRRILERLADVRIGVVCLGALMVLVAACTLAQVQLGTFGAVDVYIRSWVLWMPALGTRLPVFPGGATIGLAFAVNLLAATIVRHSWRAGRLGLLLAHLGLLLLVGGEFLTAALSVESRLVFEEGTTKSWSEAYRGVELALTDVTDAHTDRVHAVAGWRLARGGEIADPRLPLVLRVVEWHPNAHLARVGAKELHGHPVATHGAGKGLHAHALPPVAADDETDAPAALLELSAGPAALGTWLVSTELEPQALSHAGRRYVMALRPVRSQHPFSLTLLDFTHDRYAGTDIPKNFSSRVRLVDPGSSQDREVLIWMNHPLRYRGLTFYQASFGKDDTLSVLQVVRNPGWTLPYLACALVAAGLAWHFLARLVRRRAAGGES